MTSRAICVAVVLAALPAAGCGTVANLTRSAPGSGGKVPFGGVRQDLASLEKAVDGKLGPRAHPNSEAEQYPQWAVAFLYAADLPFTLVGDFVTWPYAASYTFINQPVPTPPITFAGPVVAQATPVPPGTRPMPIPLPPLPGALGQPKAPPPDLLPKPAPLPSVPPPPPAGGPPKAPPLEPAPKPTQPAPVLPPPPAEGTLKAPLESLPKPTLPPPPAEGTLKAAPPPESLPSPILPVPILPPPAAEGLLKVIPEDPLPKPIQMP